MLLFTHTLPPLRSALSPSSTVSYDPEQQWCCALEGPAHPQVDTARLSWTRARPWRPPQDARNLVRAAARGTQRISACTDTRAILAFAQEEVSRALPGNTVLAAPANTERARDPAEALADWGGQWRGAKKDS